MATKKYLDGAGVAQVWQATKDYVNANSSAVAAGALIGSDAAESTWAQRVTMGDGAATIEKMLGNTVLWNQLNNNNGYASTTGVTVTKNNDGSWTLNGTETADGGVFITTASIAAKSGEKFLLKGCPTGGGSSTYYMGLGGALADTGNGGIQTIASDANIALRLIVKSGASFNNVTIWPQVFNLTRMFGAGNEPSTVAEFETMFPEAYYPYDAGSLLSVNIEGVASSGDGWTAEHTIPVADYFPNGMRSAGTVRDELSAGAAVTRVGSRAYQSGDESDTSVITDGTTTYYVLSTPTTVTINPPLNLTYKVERGGTESVMVPTGEQTAPPVMDVAYGGTKESIIADALSAIAAQDGPTATANHAVGTYLTMGGTLYKVTSAIASGETITPGTNVTETTVMAEVVALTQ